MKKKILIGVIVFLFILIVFVLSLSDGMIADNTEIVNVKFGKVYSQYNCLATVKGKQHYTFFNGTIKSIYCLPGEKINKGQTILEYIDPYEKVKTLKADYSGYLADFSDNNIKIIDNDLYLSADVKQEVFNNIDEKCFGVYEFDDNYYTVNLIEKSDFGFDKDGQTYYQLKFKANENHFLLNQKIIIKITLNEKSGLMVDKRALMKRNGEYFLLEEGFVDDYSHWEKYKIPVELICCDENNALISAIGIEGVRVCIVEDILRKVVEND